MEGEPPPMRVILLSRRTRVPCSCWWAVAGDREWKPFGSMHGFKFSERRNLVIRIMLYTYTHVSIGPGASESVLPRRVELFAIPIVPTCIAEVLAPNQNQKTKHAVRRKNVAQSIRSFAICFAVNVSGIVFSNLNFTQSDDDFLSLFYWYCWNKPGSN